MGLIKKSTELEIPSSVKMMVYGQAGMGKSTLALSAPAPLLLDFDGGVKRVDLAHLEGVDIVQVSSWNDVQELFTNSVNDLNPYRSIVIDTIGKMMDFIIAYCCGTRQPQIRDWGKINAEFAWLVRTLCSFDKNVIFVAHRDTRKEGDDTVFIPSLREKSYNAIVTELDLLGYLEMKSEHGQQVRTITFDPTSRNDGKNTCNLPSVMAIPQLIGTKGEKLAANDFITKQVIAPYKAMLQSKLNERKQYNDVIEAIKREVDAVTNAEEAEALRAMLDNGYAHVGSSKIVGKRMLVEKIKQLDLTVKDGKIVAKS